MVDAKPLYIDICREFMLDENYNELDKFVYMILKSMSFSNNKSYHALAPFSTEVILSMIGFNLNTRNKNAIKDSVKKLIESRMINVYEDFMGTINIEDIQLSKTYFVRVEELEKPPKYTRIYLHEAYKIMTMANKSKAKVFIVFMEIVSYIYMNETSEKYCFPNIETMEENTGIHRKTIMTYVEQLQNDSIIYHETYRRGKKKDKNVYSRWEHRQEVVEYVLSQTGGGG
jgi:hypothetical protein